MKAANPGYSPLSELSRLLRSRRPSPVELTQACLGRNRKVEQSVNVFAALPR